MSIDSFDPSVDLVDLPDLDSFRGLRGWERDQAMMRVQHAKRRLDALEASLVSEVATSLSFLDDCHHGPVPWYSAVTNSSKATAAYAVRVAALFALLPLLAAEVAAGRVGPDQVRLLARLHANDRCRPQLPASEALLVEYARTLVLYEFRMVCQRWQAHADPDGAHRDHEASRANRHLKRTQVGAGALLHAEGDALTMAIIDDILDAHTEAEYNNDLLERLQRYGDQAAKYPLSRTTRQRVFDAMLAIFLKAAGTTNTTRQVPLVTIFCTEAVLQQAIRDFFGQPSDPATPPTSQRTTLAEQTRLCETASGAPVDPHDLLIAALIGNIQRIVVDPAGRAIHLGRKRRLFTGAAREAVLLTADRCTHPGCGLRHPNIHIDHLDGWATKCGNTDPFNAGPACPGHNNDKHTHGYTVYRDQTGWHHIRPDGTEIAPRGT